MNVKIDKAGRIVLPKPLRDRLRLRQGSDLEIEERPEGVLLKPVDQRTSMVKKNGIWVHLASYPRDMIGTALLTMIGTIESKTYRAYEGLLRHHNSCRSIS